ncbi:D-alanine-D-alanine ligase [Luteimonas sp. J16]|jgi:D-alanine-D-alanine ligase|uniref:D-alanine--D-alanine ligase n=1 Tax=unclassified Luteimonas TaxID=2629088 RepID=UPI00047AE1A5|nr:MULTISPECIES: D-alanine--D-alanine ligase [unclassified Luteimonas]TWG93280.1 D-alanine-D-alanine ligase [Luteimonas sp. J16]
MSLAIPALRVTDPAAFGRVAVLMGGTSSEREVSLQSGQGVLEALRSRGVDARPVDGIPALVEAIRAGTVDRVFNILHGNRGGGEDGVVQGLLEALGVPYTGPGVLGSALSMDKIRTKQVWIAEGLPTPRFARVPAGGDLRAAIAQVGLPAFVKPSCEGSSVGAARVVGDDDVAHAVAVARDYGGEMLVEEMVVGDELTVAILGDVALPSIRIVPAGEWYDYNAKYIADDTRYLCPGLDEAGERAAGELALAAFVAAGCSGWGRVDLMRERDSGRLLLLEVNTAPGMTSHSLVPKAAAQVGIDYAELCWRVLEQTV